jgi:CRISPR system Cascade subunit CasE
MHRTLSRAFGDHPDRYAEARVLFRVDEIDEGRRAMALVQSAVPPDWSHHCKLETYLEADPQTKPFSPELRAGQRLAFRLRANPTVCRDGKREGLYREEDCLAWIERKAVESGFRIVRLAMRPPEKLRCRTSEGRNVAIASALFDGVLVVDDPERLVDAVRVGIGKAKGFGFGLLSLARR